MKSKKIILAPSGSDGDTFPMLTLGRRLRERGHTVIVCGPPNSKTMFETAGFTFEPAGLDIYQYSSNRDLSNLSPLRRWEDLQFVRKDIPIQAQALTKHAKDADIIFTGGFNYVGRSVAEAFNVKHLHIFHVPNVYPTSAHPCMNVSFQNLPGVVNSILWKINGWMQDFFFKNTLNQVRRSLGLASINNVWKYLSDQSVLAIPHALHKVPQGRVQCAYWFPEVLGEIPESFETFLKSGSTPFYFGLGSMGTSEKQKIIEIVRQACRKLKVRAVISKGWADFCGESDENLFFIGRVPHDQLFQKVAFVVHHGGPGTVSTAARAGVPQIIIPHIFDQFYWGGRLHHLEISPKPISRSQLSADTLVQRIEEAMRCPEFRVNALKIRERILQEKGIDEFFDESFQRKLGLDF